ncbi:hypothetical protein M2140_000108 [Clostridiales Family XIII bacterium PM5-7]
MKNDEQKRNQSAQMQCAFVRAVRDERTGKLIAVPIKSPTAGGVRK